MGSSIAKFLPKNDSTNCRKVQKFIISKIHNPISRKIESHPLPFLTVPPENSKTCTTLLASSTPHPKTFKFIPPPLPSSKKMVTFPQLIVIVFRYC